MTTQKSAPAGGLSSLEAASGGPFIIRHRGREIQLGSPLEMDHEEILRAVATLPPGAPRGLKLSAAAELGRRWREHYDLPDENHMRRLFYLVDRYRNEIEYDLQEILGVDLSAEWRARRWRRLLNLIDHLPRASWYSEAVSNDEEYAREVAKRMAEQSGGHDEAPPKPPLHLWGPEVAALTELLNAIRHQTYVLQAVNYSGKGQKPSPPAPAPVPETALERLRKVEGHNVRWAKHKALAARMLPHKADPAG